MPLRANGPDFLSRLLYGTGISLLVGLAATTLIVVYSLNMFGDAVRDLLDPRLRGAARRLDAHRAQPVKFGA